MKKPNYYAQKEIVELSEINQYPRIGSIFIVCGALMLHSRLLHSEPKDPTKLRNSLRYNDVTIAQTFLLKV